MKELKFAPREIFESILEYTPIATFDLVLEYGDEGVIFVKRKIEPYKDQWALPGLRMMKPEGIDDTLRRIAKNELGIKIDAKKKVLLSQYVGRFKTEKERQDISTGYFIRLDGTEDINPNMDHFTSFTISKTLPKGSVGAMYKFYFGVYKDMKSKGLL